MVWYRREITACLLALLGGCILLTLIHLSVNGSQPPLELSLPSSAGFDASRFRPRDNPISKSAILPTTLQPLTTAAVARLLTKRAENDRAAVDELRTACELFSKGRPGEGMDAELRRVMGWMCRKVAPQVHISPESLARCNKSVMYTPIGRLGNLMGLYGIIYSFTHMYGVTGYVEDNMRNTLRKYFPNISLPAASQAKNVSWEGITYQQVPEKLQCHPNEDDSRKRYYKITNYPDRNGIDVFHPYYEELQSQEFQFAPRLRRQAQEFLHHAKGNRSSATFIGFHIRRTDYKQYIETKYKTRLPEALYYGKCLQYYRKKYPDALFIVCSDDMTYVTKTLKSQRGDIVYAGNRNINDPGRDMALLASCNHSIVTVGTYGFWSAYLAGGTVLTPEAHSHKARGDSKGPLLEIQLAGAENWISIR